MEKTSDKCSRIGTILLVIGIISSIILGFSSGKTLVQDGYYFEYEQNVVLTFFIIAVGCFFSYATYLIFVALAEILYYLEDIKNFNREMTARRVQNNTEVQAQVMNKNGWKCPSCGKINANYVGTCACGTEK